MGGDSGYERPDPAQVKGRLPLASADLLDWAVLVTAATAPPGPAPSKNAAIIAALEDWASSVLANHPAAARATSAALMLNPNLTEANIGRLCDKLTQLGLEDLIDALDPTRATPADSAE
jgi:hypothetical protein